MTSYWEFHRKHHQANGNADDPEILFKKLEGKWELPMSTRRLVRYCLADLIGAGAPYSIGLAVNLHPRDFQGWLALSVWCGVAIGVIGWFGCWWVLGLWLFAFLTSFWCVFRLRMMTEHLGTPSTHCLSPNWWQRAVFLPHGTWLHDVHHANPNVPSYRLEAALALYPELAARKSVGDLLGELAGSEPSSPGEPSTADGLCTVAPSRVSTLLPPPRSNRSKAIR
jgi:fatty acid desaturase